MALGSSTGIPFLFSLVAGVVLLLKVTMKSTQIALKANLKTLAMLSIMGVLLALSGCSTTSNIVTGVTRDPISPEQVRMYSNEPANFEEIAVIEANSKGSMKFTEQAKTDAAIERLKVEAAKLGANGVIITAIADGQGAGFSFGLGGGSFGRNSGASVGAGTSTSTTYKIVTGVAIFVTESN